MDQHTAPNERQQYGDKFQGHTSVEKKRWRKLLDERFPGVVTGVLSCYGRLMLQGTLPNICFAGGMEQFLRTRGRSCPADPGGARRPAGPDLYSHGHGEM